MKQTEWTGLYKASWSAAPLVPEAYSHPAKVAFGLAQKIYEHMLENGWLKPGNKVIDPFGGIAGFGFHAMRYGLHWQGVELEPRFCKLAQQNIDLWNERYSPHFAKWGTAKISQGDSRQLSSILAGQVDGGLSSPPYADAINSGEGPGAYSPNQHDTHVNGQSYRNGGKYGASDGQLGGMSAGDWDAAVSSSPFEESLTAGKSKNLQPREGDVRKYQRTMTLDDTYGNHPANIGNDTGTTFWTAARQIVEQTYTVLKPGAYAAWVTGNFRRNGEIVDFGGQWLALCESIGFVGIEHATAWKVEKRGNQLDIFGNSHSKDISRVSFFRRLDNAKNPGEEIQSEDVWFVQKPLDVL